jgi:hypothetical protein
MNDKKQKLCQLNEQNNNNNNNNNENPLKRDSFSGRICDDLCQVLLSYLSFEDKMRFECVSKQWQKCVYEKQYSLEMNESEDKDRDKNQFYKLFNKYAKNELQSRLKTFESLIKKCKFINNIVIKLNSSNEGITEEVFKLIIKNCNNLKSIEFNFNTISEELIQEFGLKFGQNLREITFIGDIESNHINKYKKLLRLCPNLIALKGDLSLFVDSNESLVPKLTNFETRVQSKDVQLIETFAKNYGNSLKNVLFDCNYGINDNETNALIKQMVYLKNLTKLDLLLSFSGSLSKEFFDNLKAIAINCNQLKSLKLHVLGNNTSVNKQVFNCLALFKNLNVLDLSLDNNSVGMRCQSLKELKLLMNLKVRTLRMNDQFFKDIDKHLPQLKHLDVMVDKKITDNAMESLSKLSKLQSIKMKREGYLLETITDFGLKDIINNCPQIKSIVFKDRPNISESTIYALIRLALRKPRVQFNHYFHGLQEKYLVSDGFIRRVFFESSELPNNLIIKSNYELE